MNFYFSFYIVDEKVNMGRSTDQIYADLSIYYPSDLSDDAFDRFIAILSNPNFAEAEKEWKLKIEEAAFLGHKDISSIPEPPQVALYNAAHNYDYQTVFNMLDKIRVPEFNIPFEEIDIEFDENGVPYANLIDISSVGTQSGRGVYSIGAAFEDLYQIKEYEDDDMYIPNSYYCGMKCYRKYFGEPYTDEFPGYAAHGNSTQAIKKYVENELKREWSKAPKIYKADRYSIKQMNTHHVSSSNSKIVLISLKGSEYHAILDKKGRLSTKQITDKIVFIKDRKLVGDDYPVEDWKVKPFIDSFYVYDIETDTTRLRTQNILLPAAVAWMKVNMKSIPRADDPFSSEEINSYDIICDEFCLQYMLDEIVAIESDNPDPIYIFAHNGSRFDTRFFKGLIDGIKFKDEIKSGSQLKSMTIIYKEKTIIFRDSILFLQTSLKMAGKMMKCKYQKIEGFDIVNKSLAWYKSTNEWREYLKYDVLALGNICKVFEKYLREFGTCICHSMGLPGVSWNLIMKTCYEMKHVKICKHPTTEKFLRSACYGGRILHYKNYYNMFENGSEGLISLDGNSLYPSAMALGCYPIGDAQVFEGDKVNPMVIIEQFLNKGKLFIAEVTLVGNVRYSLIPYRTTKGQIIYKSGELRGVYTSVEIEEALKDGWQIKEVHRGIYWERKRKIFTKLIEAIYEKRLAIKKETSDKIKLAKKKLEAGLIDQKECDKECIDAYDGMEYVLKILLNAMYGKFLEMIDCSSSFSDEAADNSLMKHKHVTSKRLPNGQFENTFTYKYPLIRKPVHIGAFILSYARAITNNVIRAVGPENIVYGDTDSLYIPRECLKKSGFIESKGLGGFKNDYGDDTFIKEALFLDLKRYYIEFIKPDDEGNRFTCKFNGLNFKSNMSIQNWVDTRYLEENDYYGINFLTDEEFNRDTIQKAIIDLYVWFAANPKTLLESGRSIIQEKWSRLLSGVVIEEKQFLYQVDPNKRANWEGGISYPFGFDKNLPVPPMGKYDPNFHYKVDSDDQYSINSIGLFSALPIIGEKSVMLKKENSHGFVSSFVIASDGKPYMRKRIKNNKDKEKKFNYFKYGDFGALEPVNIPDDDYLYNIFIVNKEKNNKHTPHKRVTKEEQEELINSIQLFIRKLVMNNITIIEEKNGKLVDDSVPE